MFVTVGPLGHCLAHLFAPWAHRRYEEVVERLVWTDSDIPLSGSAVYYH